MLFSLLSIPPHPRPSVVSAGSRAIHAASMAKVATVQAGARSAGSANEASHIGLGGCGRMYVNRETRVVRSLLYTLHPRAISTRQRSPCVSNFRLVVLVGEFKTRGLVETGKEIVVVLVSRLRKHHTISGQPSPTFLESLTDPI